MLTRRSKENYNGILGPLIEAKQDAAKPLILRVRTGSMPTEHVHYKIPFHHGLPEQMITGGHMAAVADARQEEVLKAVRKMHGLEDPAAPTEFIAPSATVADAPGDHE